MLIGLMDEDLRRMEEVSMHGGACHLPGTSLNIVTHKELMRLNMHQLKTLREKHGQQLRRKEIEDKALL